MSSLDFMFSNAAASPTRHRSILRFAKSSSDLRIFYNNITNAFSLPACNIKHRRSLDEMPTHFEG